MISDSIVPFLPHFQAVLNVTTTVLLCAGYLCIRNRKQRVHQLLMIAALVVSSIFLTSYLTYHAKVGYMPFAGEGVVRPFYFTLLASHVILAALIVPMVILTVWQAVRGNFIAHPNIARWTLPCWLYVSVSGILVYILGFHLYRPSV